MQENFSKQSYQEEFRQYLVEAEVNILFIANKKLTMNEMEQISEIIRKRKATLEMKKIDKAISDALSLSRTEGKDVKIKIMVKVTRSQKTPLWTVKVIIENSPKKKFRLFKRSPEI